MLVDAAGDPGSKVILTERSQAVLVTPRPWNLAHMHGYSPSSMFMGRKTVEALHIALAAHIPSQAPP